MLIHRLASPAQLRLVSADAYDPSVSDFVDLFREPAHPTRAKFLARLFGIFSEDIVSLWASMPSAPYENLGRPTLRFADETTASTLDFTFRSRASNHTFVVEMKCEIEYHNFRYFVLESPEQLAHHTKPAFRAFLRAARDPAAAHVRVRGHVVPIQGAILVWGAGTRVGCDAVRQHYGLADVPTVESMIRDLADVPDPRYLALLDDRRRWANEMFDGLS